MKCHPLIATGDSNAIFSHRAPPALISCEQEAKQLPGVLYLHWRSIRGDGIQP